jgi:hypothetical protein
MVRLRRLHALVLTQYAIVGVLGETASHDISRKDGAGASRAPGRSMPKHSKLSTHTLQSPTAPQCSASGETQTLEHVFRPCAADASQSAASAGWDGRGALTRAARGAALSLARRGVLLGGQLRAGVLVRRGRAAHGRARAGQLQGVRTICPQQRGAASHGGAAVRRAGGAGEQRRVRRAARGGAQRSAPAQLQGASPSLRERESCVWVEPQTE